MEGGCCDKQSNVEKENKQLHRQVDGLFSKDGLHLNKRGAAVLGKGFLRALGDGIGQLSLN